MSNDSTAIRAILADMGISWQTIAYCKPQHGPFRVVRGILHSVYESHRAKVLTRQGAEAMGGLLHACEFHADVLNIEYARWLMLKPDGPKECKQCGGKLTPIDQLFMQQCTVCRTYV